MGGPAAHIAIMQREFVERRGWLSSQEFLDLVGQSQLIPGPTSSELAMHIGHRRAGWKGLWIAGLAFLLPAAFLVALLAHLYTRYQQVPQLTAALHGLQAVVLALILRAVLGLATSAWKSGWQRLLGLLCLVLYLLGVGELWLIFASGSLALFRERRPWSAFGLLLVPLLAQACLPQGSQPYSLLTLTLFFFQVGAFLYGSGYVLLAFLQTSLVSQWGWLTSGQLLDAIAVGQFTPGPLFTTATFIGWLLGGAWAAGLATLAIFLPSFLWVSLLAAYPKAWSRGFLDAVNASSLALMLGVALQMLVWQLSNWPLLLLSFCLLPRVHPTLPLLLGLAYGLLRS